MFNQNLMWNQLEYREKYLFCTYQTYEQANEQGQNTQINGETDRLRKNGKRKQTDRTNGKRTETANKTNGQHSNIVQIKKKWNSK